MKAINKINIYYLLYVFAGIILGISSLKLDTRILITLISGFFCLYILIKRPVFVIIAIIISSSSIFSFEALQVSIGGGFEISIQEAIILLMLFFYFFKLLIVKDIKLFKSSVNIPMMLFLTAVVISSLWSILHFNTSKSLVFWEARTLLQYSFFFLIPYIIRNTKDLRFVVGSLFVIGSVVSILIFVQFIVGPSLRLFIGGEEIVQILSLGTDVGARVKPPGELLVFTMLLVGLSIFGVHSKLSSKHVYVLLIIILSIGLLLSFTRSEYAAALVGFFIILYFAKFEERKKLIIMAFLGLVLIIAVGLAIEMYSIYVANDKIDFFGVIGERFFSIFKTGSYSTESSFGTRTYEFTEAIPYIKNHPILGIGFHNAYRLRWSVDNYYGYHFVHNGYLFLQLKMGLIGLVVYIWLSFSFLKRSLFIYNNLNDLYLKGIVLGSFITYIGILICNITQPALWAYNMVPCAALLMGMCEAIWNIVNYNSLNK